MQTLKDVSRQAKKWQIGTAVAPQRMEEARDILEGIFFACPYTTEGGILLQHALF